MRSWEYEEEIEGFEYADIQRMLSQGVGGSYDGYDTYEGPYQLSVSCDGGGELGGEPLPEAHLSAQSHSETASGKFAPPSAIPSSACSGRRANISAVCA